MSQTTLIYALIIFLTPSLWAQGLEERFVEWYFLNTEMNESSLLEQNKGASLNIDDESHTLNLRNGWSCDVGSASKQLPLYEARRTKCTKDSESIEFSVQCERNRAKDHVQITFRSIEKGLDFIEVGCELRLR